MDSDLSSYLNNLGGSNQQVSNDFKQRLHALTIDQLTHEQSVLEHTIQAHQTNFSENQIRDKDRYASICKVHGRVIGTIGQNDGLLYTIKADYSHLQISHNKLGEQLRSIDIEWVNQKWQQIHENGKNNDIIIEIVNIPNILNQCLQSNQFVQATKLIRHYYNNIQIQNQPKVPLIVELLDKEVQVIKQKLIRNLYISLESSFLQNCQRSTKELLTLLRALGESKVQIDTRWQLSRAKYLKDYVQGWMMKNGQKQSEQLIKNTLQFTVIFQKSTIDGSQMKEEFDDNRVDYEEWMLDRIDELRGIVSVICSYSQRIEDIRMIDRHVQEFNKQATQCIEVGDIIETTLPTILTQNKAKLKEFTKQEILNIPQTYLIIINVSDNIILTLLILIEKVRKCLMMYDGKIFSL